DLFKSEHRDGQLIVRRNGGVACVGAGHFTCTIRRETLAGMPDEPSLKAIEGQSELRWLGLPPDRLGFWRRSTPQAWVHPMGNVPEEWMREELAALISKGASEMSRKHEIPAAKRRLTGMIPISLRSKMARLMQILGPRAYSNARRKKRKEEHFP